MQIIGAGMAGLLAANMLARRRPVVFEQQVSLPNNHSAVLRFGSDKIGDLLGIPFRKVRMMKTYLPWRNRVADGLAYSRKCTGVSRSDRSIASDVFSADRWIAPPDLIERMAAEVKIEFGTSIGFVENRPRKEPLISTMPMPALMGLLNYPIRPEFKSVEGANLRATIADCDAFVSLYIPDPAFAFNRLSITGNELIAEYAFPNPDEAAEALFQLESHEFINPEREIPIIADILGLDPDQLFDVKIIPQKYAKIQPIDANARKNFMHWATNEFNIFSLGRFATWRPGLLLDDLVQDVRLIERWIEDSRYDMKFHR